jgi:hypothetical protein
MSPLLSARLDTERSLNGCRILKNFIPKTQGGAIQRPPLHYVGISHNQSLGESALFPFQFSTSARYVLEIGTTNIKIWSMDGTETSVIFPSGVYHYMVNPRQLQFFQENDVMWFAGSDIYPFTITREESGWIYRWVSPEWPALVIDTFAESSGTRPLYGVVFSGSLASTNTTAAFQRQYKDLEIRTTGTAFVGTIQLQRRTPQYTDATGAVIPASAYVTATTVTNASLTDELRATYTHDITAAIVLSDSNVVFPEYRLVITRTSGSGTVNVQAVGAFPSRTIGGSFQVSAVSPINGFAVAKWSHGGIMSNEWAGLGGTGENNAAMIQVRHARDTAKLALGLSASGTSSTIQITGEVSLVTVGTWHGTVNLQQLDEVSNTWETLQFWDGSGNRNVSATVDIEGSDRSLRLNFVDAAGTPSGTPTAYLQAIESKATGLVRLHRQPGWPLLQPPSMADWCVVRILKSPYATTPTRYYSYNAWRPAQGYPRAVTKHERRLWFGGTTLEPQNLWASEIDEPQNFSLGNDDNSPLSIQLSSNNFNEVQWILSQSDGLAVGTRGDEWVITGGDASKAITPSSVMARKQSSYGSASIGAISFDDVALFVQRGAQKVREFSYSFENNKHVSVDLSVFSEHLLRAGVVEVAYSSSPDGVLYCVLANGTMSCMTYERAQGVVAWFTVETTGGLFESVAVINGEDGQSDEVWVIINRGGTRTVERYRSNWWGLINETAGASTVYLDAMQTIVLTGLINPTLPAAAWMEGQQVRVIGLSSAGVRTDYGLKTVSSGLVTIGSISNPQPNGTYYLGYTYEARLKTMPMEAQLPGGSAQGMRWRISHLTAEIFRTGAGQYRSNSSMSWEDLPISSQESLEVSPNTYGLLKTGKVQAYVPGSYVLTVDMEFRNDSPLPLNILAVTPIVEPYGS